MSLSIYVGSSLNGDYLHVTSTTRTPLSAGSSLKYLSMENRSLEAMRTLKSYNPFYSKVNQNLNLL